MTSGMGIACGKGLGFIVGPADGVFDQPTSERVMGLGDGAVGVGAAIVGRDAIGGVIDIGFDIEAFSSEGTELIG